MCMGDACVFVVGLEGVGGPGAVVEGHVQQRHPAPAADDHEGQQGCLQTG